MAVTNLTGVDGQGCVAVTDTGTKLDKDVYAWLHIISQEAAVGSRVGCELLFIQRLEVIQSLLGCVAENAVRIALYDQGQRRRNDTPHIQGTVIEHRKMMPRQLREATLGSIASSPIGKAIQAKQNRKG